VISVQEGLVECIPNLYNVHALDGSIIEQFMRQLPSELPK
jgi:hypothetical protein